MFGGVYEQITRSLVSCIASLRGGWATEQEALLRELEHPNEGYYGIFLVGSIEGGYYSSPGSIR
jgi:hypothetical protein